VGPLLLAIIGNEADLILALSGHHVAIKPCRQTLAESVRVLF